MTPQAHRWLALCFLCFAPRLVQSVIPCGKCMCDEHILTCNVPDSDVRQLDEVLPSDEAFSIARPATLFTVLYVRCDRAPPMPQAVTRRLLRRFTKVTELSIIQCNVGSIDADALVDLRRLKKLEVSSNDLKSVPETVFSSLPELESVSLSRNPISRLPAKIFDGVPLKKLGLNDCRFAEFPDKALSGLLTLQQLSMAANQIRTMPSTVLPIVRRLDNFFLDRNPLVCNCDIKWLVSELNWTNLSPISNKKPTCKSPYSLMDLELPKLSPEQLSCSAPSIGAVQLRVSANAASVRCSASVPDGEPPPRWTYRRVAVGRQESREASRRPHVGTDFDVSLRRGAGSDRLLLLAASADGKSSTFNVSFRWPPKAPKAPASGSSPPPQRRPAVLDSTKVVAGIPGKSSPADGAGYYAEKQFTLVEMIVAVIGTFMATTLLFLLSCQFTRWYSKRDRKRWANYASHQYAYTYNPHQSCSQEYDVPRIDQPCLPPKPPTTTTTATASREFLDFNNPRVMYNV